MIRYVSLLIITLINVEGEASTFEFSKKSCLYLLTVQQGEDIDQAWGHSAIWIKDSLKQIDLVFEFTSTGKMRWLSNIKLLFGKDIYQLRIIDHETFKHETNLTNQCISYQIVTQNRSSIKRIYHSLLKEYQTKKQQTYSLASNNCSSLLFKHLKPYVNVNQIKRGKSIRDRLRISGRLSAIEELFYIDLILSKHADKSESSVLPFTPELLAVTFGGQPIPKIGIRSVSRLISFVAFLFTLTLLAYHAPHLYISLLMWSTGLFGICLLLFQVYSEEPLLKENHQLLWMNPLNLIRGRFHSITEKKYLLFFTIMLLLSIAVSLFDGHISTLYMACCLTLLCSNMIALSVSVPEWKILCKAINMVK